MLRISLICLFLSILFNVLGYGYITTLRKENNALEAEKNTLKIEIKEKEDAMEQSRFADIRAEKTIKEIRTITKTVKSVCDCANSAIEPVQLLNIIRGEGKED